MRISSELFDFMANICQFLDLCIQSICLNLLCLSNRYELRKLLKFRVLFSVFAFIYITAWCFGQQKI